LTPWRFATAFSAPMSLARPIWSTGMIALVRLVMRRSTSAGSAL
jgi:hypothetical protein